MRPGLWEVIRSDTDEVYGHNYDSPRDAREAAEHFAEVLRVRCLAYEILPTGRYVSHVADPPEVVGKESNGERRTH